MLPGGGALEVHYRALVEVSGKTRDRPWQTMLR